MLKFRWIVQQNRVEYLSVCLLWTFDNDGKVSHLSEFLSIQLLLWCVVITYQQIKQLYFLLYLDCIGTGEWGFRPNFRFRCGCLTLCCVWGFLTVSALEACNAAGFLFLFVWYGGLVDELQVERVCWMGSVRTIGSFKRLNGLARHGWWGVTWSRYRPDGAVRKYVVERIVARDLSLIEFAVHRRRAILSVI